MPLTVALLPMVAFGYLCKAEPQQMEAAKMIQAELKGECARCHQPFVDEWKKSGHAKAFVRPTYQKTAANTEDQRVNRCDSCHAPEAILTAGLEKVPQFRGKNAVPQQGVMCVSCHMDSNGVMHGPYGGETDFHKSAKDPSYQGSNAVCLSCHGQTMGVGNDYNQIESFATYARNQKGASCLDCHMRPIERQASTETGKAKRQCGEHTWHGAYDKLMLNSVVTLQLRVSGAMATVSLANIAGHMMPGGAWRQAVLEISASNKIVKREMFYREPGGKTDTRLKPFERRRVTAEIPVGSKVQARLWWKPMPDTAESDRVIMAQDPRD